MRKLLIIFIYLWFSSGYSQKIYTYYVYFTHSSLANDFVVDNNELLYAGTDTDLKVFLEDRNVIGFRQALTEYPVESIQRAYIIDTEDNTLVPQLIELFPSFFSFFEDATDEVIELNSYPDDYGTTSPIGNSGAAYERRDLDYLNAEQAWDITTGTVPIGLSDGKINNSDADFSAKTTFINYSYGSLTYNPNVAETFHGTSVGAIMAAQGDNAHGSTGVCYDCSIVATNYGFSNLLPLANTGVKIINMSWSGGGYHQANQDAINYLVDDLGVVLVGSAGNDICYQTNEEFFYANFNITTNLFYPKYVGPRIAYPASYDGVISVSSVEHYYAVGDTAAVDSVSPFFPVSVHVENSASTNQDATDINNPIGVKFNGWARYKQKPDLSYQIISPNGIVGNNTMNVQVDILAPANRVINYSKFVEEGGLVAYNASGGTSSATPFVTGTVGLMRSVNSCLTPYEVDNILKLTTKDVENMPINQHFMGEIGAGALNIGDAVEFTNEMKKSDGNAVIDNHIFNRFNFNLERINNKLTIENVTLKDDCVADFTAKNQIHLKPGTDLSPNNNGSVHLKIDEALLVTCSESPRPGSPEKSTKNSIQSDLKSKLYPNPNNGNFTIVLAKETLQNIHIAVYDILGKNVYNGFANESKFDVNVPNLQSGLYIVKISSERHSETFKFVKK